MKLSAARREDLLWLLALALPLAVRVSGEEGLHASERLVLLLLGAVVVGACAWVFARAAQRPIGAGLPACVMGFVLMLPGPVGWGTALLALSFAAVFGREMFGGRPILPPALIGLAFALFSFPAGGFEARGVLGQPPDMALALACLAGAAVLLVGRTGWAWQVAIGCVLGVMAAGMLTGDMAWWKHLSQGSFAAGVLFLAAAPESAAARPAARLVHGLLVGVLVVVIRLHHPDQPDGVVYAALLGALFAPLIERGFGWRYKHG